MLCALYYTLIYMAANTDCVQSTSRLPRAYLALTMRYQNPCFLVHKVSVSSLFKSLFYTKMKEKRENIWRYGEIIVLLQAHTLESVCNPYSIVYEQ